jgi:hypothetical protein
MATPCALDATRLQVQPELANVSATAGWIRSQLELVVEGG